jgi:hypothetical protein
VTEPQSSSDANPFYVRSGEDVRITYGILRASGEFPDYQDRQRTLSFSGREGEIDSLEAGICRMLPIELHREDVNAYADLNTLTLLLHRGSTQRADGNLSRPSRSRPHNTPVFARLWPRSCSTTCSLRAGALLPPSEAESSQSLSCTNRPHPLASRSVFCCGASPALARVPCGCVVP